MMKYVLGSVRRPEKHLGTGLTTEAYPMFSEFCSVEIVGTLRCARQNETRPITQKPRYHDAT
jgi:hypothetical protein